jgi:prepilin-type N-terminal cleavage/methylation domain-containing protein
MLPKKNNKGFTLIELLLVIAIIAILALVVIVALNPVKRLQDARNARRYADVDSILTAVHEYVIDNLGSLPAGISTSEAQLGTCATGGSVVCTTAATACVDLSTPLAKYLKTIPVDPLGSPSATFYSVVKDTNNIVTIKACDAEGGASISISR